MQSFSFWKHFVGSPYFSLKASNGHVIDISEPYSSTSAMETGIASLKNNAPSAGIEDLIQSLMNIS